MNRKESSTIIFIKLTWLSFDIAPQKQTEKGMKIISKGSEQRTLNSRRKKIKYIKDKETSQ